MATTEIKPLEQMATHLKALAGGWGQFTLLGSFALYVLGYLALRFHLTALGLVTDLSVLDERYLFNGMRFVVYLVSAVPSIVLLLLVPAALGRLLWLLLPVRRRQALAAWCCRPWRLALLGIVAAVLGIQFVMRQCFVFSDLLLAPRLPAEPAWLVALLHGDALKAPYFAGLVALCLLSLALLWPLLRLAQPTPALRGARALLGFLVAVQFLLLPVNYGVLIADKSLPRVAAAGTRVLAADEAAWLLWEGKEGITFLLRGADGRRSLLTQPRAQVLTVEVIGTDAIMPTLFDATGAPRRLVPTRGVTPTPTPTPARP